MYLSTASTHLLLATSLVAASPSQAQGNIQRRRTRGSSHHVPDAYLSLFDPKKHEHLAAELKSHQQRLLPDDFLGTTQQILAAVIPTTENVALKKNLANIRAQCKHTIEKSVPAHDNSRTLPHKNVVRSAAKKSEAAGSSLFAASVFAIGGAIGVAALLL